ncbi:ABC transporter permease subunit [Nocardia sp. SC052]|uniref:ABC transporter permease subunit n=1 Tax=Nocardia sichangensis TaxID=3385975 RepID=UPI0039A37619
MELIQFAILGLGLGAVYAVLAESVVVVYKGSGVLNFAAGAQAMLGAFLFYRLRDDYEIPGVLALAITLLAMGAVGAVTYQLVIRPLRSAPATSRLVATLAVMTLMLQVVDMTWAKGGTVLSVRSPFPETQLTIASSISVTADRLLFVLTGILACFVLVMIERHTRLGLATRAVAENRLVAASMGWSPDAIGNLTWASGAALAAVAGILTAPLSGLSTGTLTFLVVPALAAALTGGFRSLPLTLAGGLMIGIAQSELTRYVSTPGWGTAAPLLLVVVVLTVRGSNLPSQDDVSERRPSVGSGRVGWPAVAGFAAALTLIVAAPVSALDSITATLLLTIILLSIVIVTGYSGQLSLAQMTIAGLGAYFTAVLSIEADVPTALAIPLAVALCIPVSLLIGIVAARSRGASLAISTLGLAVAIDALVIANPQRLSALVGQQIGPLAVGELRLDAVNHPTAFAVLVLLVVTVIAVVMSNLRRGATGRRLLAVRANERAAASLGVSVVSVKIYAFCLAACVAAGAGALMEARVETTDLTGFTVFGSITAILNTTIGGVGWVSGALVGTTGAPGTVQAQILTGDGSGGSGWMVLIGAFVVLVIILCSPDGISALISAQATTLRQRLHMTHRHQLTPLALESTLGSPAVRPPVTLTAKAVGVRFGGVAALDDIDIVLTTGEIVGVIGPNGAGKSTLIDTLSGFRRPNSGRVILNGKDVTRLGPAARTHHGLVRSFQQLELFEDLTVMENVRLAADHTPWWRYATDLLRPANRPPSTQVLSVITACGLNAVTDRLPRELDYGRRHLLSIARACASDASLILLDEPAAGLQGADRARLGQLLRDLTRNWGVGLLLVEHDIDLVFRTCDRVIVMDFGRIIASGPPAEVRLDARVIEAYLGKTEISVDSVSVRKAGEE